MPQIYKHLILGCSSWCTCFWTGTWVRPFQTRDAKPANGLCYSTQRMTRGKIHLRQANTNSTSIYCLILQLDKQSFFKNRLLNTKIPAIYTLWQNTRGLLKSQRQAAITGGSTSKKFLQWEWSKLYPLQQQNLVPQEEKSDMVRKKSCCIFLLQKTIRMKVFYLHPRKDHLAFDQYTIFIIMKLMRKYFYLL